MTNGFGIYKGSKSEVTGVNEKKNGMAVVTIPFTFFIFNTRALKYLLILRDIQM